MIPVGIGTGAISVFGALYGARRLETIHEMFKYTHTIGFLGALIIGILTAVFSKQLALLFGGAGLNKEISEITVLLSFYVMFSSLSIISGFIFQSFGKGAYSLAFTFFKQIVLTLIFIFLFIGLKDIGVYYGIILANFIGGVIEIVVLYFYINRFDKYYAK